MSVVNSIDANWQKVLESSPAEEPVSLEYGVEIPPYFRWKRVVDLILSGILFVPVALIVGLLVVLVRLTSRGPAVYRQVRVGRDGRRFTLYKIRTMAQNAEAKTGAVWARPDDPRTTGVGRILRTLHLDEFPQLFNVLRGEMSLIGPRPERPELVRVLAGEVPGYCDRLAVPPGITGLAQVNLPPDSDLQSVARKLAVDHRYIREAGIWLDLRIFLATACHFLGIPSDLRVKLFRLERTVPETGIGGNGQDVSGTSKTAASSSQLAQDENSGEETTEARRCLVRKPR